MRFIQSALKIVYPDQCVSCGTLVEGLNGVCGRCWSKTPFVSGARCNVCSVPILGEGDAVHDATATCDRCLVQPPPWSKGRAALLYEDSARALVLRLKHGDRTDLFKPAARWMMAAGADLMDRNAILVPVPIHWRRLFRRRYNQSAELARELSVLSGLEHRPDALVRTRVTQVQDGKSIEERFENLGGAIRARDRLEGASVILIDDVLTSGATLSAATEACLAAGAAEIDVLVLARVVIPS